jgi:hypothetical protein
MALPIIERPLYGQLKIETSPWNNTLVWTDRTSSLVNGISYSQGGRVGQPGSSQVDVGTLNASFKNLSSVPEVGYLVRISFSKFSGYAWVGYVQDVSQRIVFDNSVALNTPITITTLHCSDWVGYISQFQLVGAGGASVITGASQTDSNYDSNFRVGAIMKSIDPTMATQIIQRNLSGSPGVFSDTDLVGSIADHLDLIAITANAFWFPNNILPTNKTTGRTSLVNISYFDNAASTGIVFRDVLGVAGDLHYTEIDFENSTQNVANDIVLNNRGRVHISDPEITKIGGFNESNFMIVDDVNVVGLPLEREQRFSSPISIMDYGNRQATFNTNVEMTEYNVANYIGNPSLEYSDDGWSGGANINVRRRKPLTDGGLVEAFSGEWAIRGRQATAGTTGTIQYFGTESDGTPVQAGTSYTVFGYGLKMSGSHGDTQFRVRVDWKDEAEATISTAVGSNVALSVSAWVRAGVTATAPAGAVRAVIQFQFSRSGGGNISVGQKYFIDAINMFRTGLSNAYFDGDTPWTTSYGYMWTGGVGSSPSLRLVNNVDNLAKDLLDYYQDTEMKISRIRWNAQEHLSAVPALSVGKTIQVVYKGSAKTCRIIGIDGNIDPERYMLDYYLLEV